MLLWNEQGFISPIGVEPTSKKDRSPYKISLLDFYKRFVKVSPERKKLLDGLIAFRSEMHSLGVTEGFQWIDGSFLENIEKIENRSPNDIDTVVFVEGYSTDNVEGIIQFISDKRAIKEQFNIDFYHEWITELTPRQLVDVSVYWYGMWSHTRNQQWKGFIQIDLNPDEDEQLQRYLKEGDDES